MKFRAPFSTFRIVMYEYKFANDVTTIQNLNFLPIYEHMYLGERLLLWIFENFRWKDAKFPEFTIPNHFHMNSRTRCGAKPYHEMSPCMRLWNVSLHEIVKCHLVWDCEMSPCMRLWNNILDEIVKCYLVWDCEI